jgi:hypothetical protein
MQNFIIFETQRRQNGKIGDYQNDQENLQKLQNVSAVIGNEQDDILPPFGVLLKWLTYVYRQTGEWPVPPDGLPLPNSSRPQDSLQVKTSSTRENCAGQNIPSWSGGGVEAARNKRLRIVPDTENVQETKSQEDRPKYSTGFDYINSEYFAEACRLIETYAKQPIQDYLLFGCKHVLSLIIAWCHFPLFKEVGNRQGRWMILGTAHCARELRMRVANFKDCIEQLEIAGLIITGQAGSDIIERQTFEQLRYDCSNVSKIFGEDASKYWSRQSVQTKTLVYRVAKEIELDTVLPLFNPFISGIYITTELLNTSERPEGSLLTKAISGKDLVPNGQHWESLLGNFESISGSFPSVPCYDKLIHDVDNGVSNEFLREYPTKNDSPDNRLPMVDPQHSLLSSSTSNLLGKLTQEQRTKFDFLNHQACFEGYRRKDGRATLDTPEAFKFACRENLTIEQLQLRYSQVSEMWSNGQCNRNPIGLLHWAIAHNSDPRGYDDYDSSSGMNQNEQKGGKEVLASSGVTSTHSSTTQRHSQPLDTTYSNNCFGGSSSRRSQQWHSYSPNTAKSKHSGRGGRRFPIASKLAEDNQPFTENQNNTDESYDEPTKNLAAQPPNWLNDPIALWKDIVDFDLAGRFRLDDRELTHLVGSRLKMPTDVATPENEKQIKIVLRSIIEEHQLGIATRNIIQLAIRQKLGPGYTLFFTSAS